jgi:hypothetical protein
MLISTTCITQGQQAGTISELHALSTNPLYWGTLIACLFDQHHLQCIDTRAAGSHNLRTSCIPHQTCGLGHFDVLIFMLISTTYSVKGSRKNAAMSFTCFTKCVYVLVLFWLEAP